ncbi:Transcription initiation factor IIE subunit beta [Linum perenne]
MDYKNKLDKFNKQAERCSEIKNMASKAGSSSASKSGGGASLSSANGRNAAPGIKFSNDTERLQQINSIRKAPVGAQMKRVIGLLLKTRRAYTPEQINEACYVDVRSNKELFDSLKANPKVNYDGRSFSYKSTHNLLNKDELLKLIRRFPEGMAVIELKDAYPRVMEDLQDLKGAGEIWLMSNFDSKEDIAYPNDPRAVIKVDDELKQLFREIPLPLDMLDIERDLQKNGMRPATDTAKRRAAAQMDGIPTKPKTKKKKHEISKRTKLTNSHLPELFKNTGS